MTRAFYFVSFKKKLNNKPFEGKFKFIIIALVLFISGILLGFSVPFFTY